MKEVAKGATTPGSSSSSEPSGPETAADGEAILKTWQVAREDDQAQSSASGDSVKPISSTEAHHEVLKPMGAVGKEGDDILSAWTAAHKPRTPPPAANTA